MFPHGALTPPPPLMFSDLDTDELVRTLGLAFLLYIIFFGWPGLIPSMNKAHGQGPVGYAYSVNISRNGVETVSTDGIACGAGEVMMALRGSGNAHLTVYCQMPK